MPRTKGTVSVALPLEREEIIRDYRLAYQSRQASLIGRREVLSGKAKFGIFGDGKERVNIEEDVRRKELRNVLLAGVHPKREMPLVLASSDVCLAILQNIPMFRTTYPNKVFDYMAAGRATILVIDGVIREVIETSKGGIFVEPGDDVQLARTVLDLANDPERVRQMGRNAREYLV